MPLEIRELHIKAVLSDEPGNRGGTQGAPQGGADKEAIVAECVEQVMDLLKQRAER